MTTEQTDPRLHRAINVLVSMQRTASPKAIEAFMPYLRKDAELLLAEIDGPEPTWRDVIRAMRAAGLKLAGPEQISERWRYRALDYNGVSAGDVATNHLGERWVTLYGSRDGWTFEMKNPTPAEVLAAARLVGLGGSDE